MQKDVQQVDRPREQEKIFSLLGNGDFDTAEKMLNEILSVDYDNDQILSALKIVRFWSDRKHKMDLLKDHVSISGFLKDEWKHFHLHFMSTLDMVNEKCLVQVKNWVFGTILDSNLHLMENSQNDGDIQILREIGRCYKFLGDYDRAIRIQEKALKQSGNQNAGLLAELADSYALINETKIAKVFFREAFFINSRDIELSDIESDLIIRLVEKIRQTGISENDIIEWIGVYGVINGVFNIKRDLRPIEVARLHQSINTLKQEIKVNKRDKRIKPRLIYRYFWLIDHLVRSGESRAVIDEIMMDIKLLDPYIYRLFAE